MGEHPLDMATIIEIERSFFQMGISLKDRQDLFLLGNPPHFSKFVNSSALSYVVSAHGTSNWQLITDPYTNRQTFPPAFSNANNVILAIKLDLPVLLVQTHKFSPRAPILFTSWNIPGY